ncbi:MAG: L-serine ammonia-lyase, iron-sulfur-dependent subunit beta [Anaerolineae bacterium]
MSNTRDVSSFDIIGPIMVGPSSSHTAGAVRLGLIGAAVLGGQPTDALIELHGSFAHTGQGHGTDKALVAGLLGMPTDDDNLRYSFAIAAERGMAFRLAETDLGDDAHPNSVRLTLSGADGRQVQLTGASVGGGMVQVTGIQGYPVSFGGEYETLIVIADDRPGTINLITHWFLEKQLNIAFFRVERQQRRGRAIMIIEVDEPIPPEAVEAISDFEWVHWVRKIEKVST